MEQQLTLLLWVIGAGFGVTFALLVFLWNSLNNRMDRTDLKIDKLDEKLTDVDRRLCRLEGAFSNKDCCMIKDDRVIKKAE